MALIAGRGCNFEDGSFFAGVSQTGAQRSSDGLDPRMKVDDC